MNSTLFVANNLQKMKNLVHDIDVKNDLNNVFSQINDHPSPRTRLEATVPIKGWWLIAHHCGIESTLVQRHPAEIPCSQAFERTVR